MTQQEKKKIKEERGLKVVKANELIQHTKFKLSLQEQKIILYLISKFKPNDVDIKEYAFDIKTFCKVCGIDYDNGKNYQDLKNTLQNLHNKSFWLKIDDNTQILFSWINSAAIINQGDGIVKLYIHEKIKPYLLQLKQNFTQYELMYILAMQSQYSIRLYELLKSYENLHRKTFEVNELKKMFMCESESYDNFYNFRVKVLDIAVNEINRFTDIFVEFEPIQEGKKITQIEFIIKTKKEKSELLKSFSEIEKCLDE